MANIQKQVVFSNYGSINVNGEYLSPSQDVIIRFVRTSGDEPPQGNFRRLVSASFIFDGIDVTQNGVTYDLFDVKDQKYGTLVFRQSSGIQQYDLTDLPQDRTRMFYNSILIKMKYNSQQSPQDGRLKLYSSTTIQVTITYEIGVPSTGVLSSNSCQHNHQINLTISPDQSSYVHKVRWGAPSPQSEATPDNLLWQTIPAGTTVASFVVPEPWPVGNAQCLLETYTADPNELPDEEVKKLYIGKNAYSWSILVDQDKYPTGGQVVPTLVQSQYVPSSWGIYVRGYSKCKLTLSGHSPGGGSASVSKIALSVGNSKYTGTDAEYTTDTLYQDGTLQCTGEIENNYGNKANAQSAQITVYNYYSPDIINIKVSRCVSDGRLSEVGGYASVEATAIIASVNNKNSIRTFQIQFAPANSSSWGNAFSISSGSSSIIDAGFTGTVSRYKARITLIDEIQNLENSASVREVDVLLPEAILFFKDGGLNVSIGKKGSRDNAVEINPDWNIYHGDINLTALKIDCGAATARGIYKTNVGFNVPFKEIPTVVCTYKTDTYQTGLYPLVVCDITRYSFTVFMSDVSDSISHPINWIAVGP